MRKRSTGGSLVDISIARNSISDEDYFVASKSLKCRMRNVIKGFKNDKRDAKRKFWHSSRKGSKDQDSSNSDDESEFSETRSFEADILREILDALPTVRAPLGEGRGSFDRSDSGFEERDAASDILSDSGSDLEDVGVSIAKVGSVTNLPSGNESLEDVDKNVVDVADCIESDTTAATLFRMKRCLSQRDAKVGSGIRERNNSVPCVLVPPRHRTISAPTPCDAAQRRALEELQYRRRSTAVLDPQRRSTLYSSGLGVCPEINKSRGQLAMELREAKEEERQLYMLMPLLL